MVRCFYGSQNELKRWEVLYRKNNNCSSTELNHHLQIEGFGEVKTSTNPNDNEVIVIEVELVNKDHGNRWTTFTFDKTEVFKSGRLSVTKQGMVYETAEEIIAEFMRELASRTCGFNSGKAKPRLIQQLIDINMDVCVFVTREEAEWIYPVYVVYVVRDLRGIDKNRKKQHVERLYVNNYKYFHVGVEEGTPIKIEKMGVNFEIIYGSKRTKIEI